MGQRLLIVEDSEPARRALRILLARRGYEVAEAATVAAGLAGLEAPGGPPACVVLDLMLPDGDGEEVLRRIREAGWSTCVVVCTGSNDADRLERARHLGADAVLLKPIRVQDILDACEDLLSR